MYQVKIFDGIDDKQGLVIHSPYIDDLKISSGVVTQVLNGIDDFAFSINLKNPAWGKVRPYRTLIQVKDIKNNQTIFNGRVLKPKGSMSGTGMFSRSFSCESILAYLRDSAQRHAEIHDTTIREFFEIIIENHNRQVEPHKRFKVGNVTVTSLTDNVYRYLGYEDTFETIKDKLIDRLGGYLVLRQESGGNYLDYLEDVGKDVDTTPIRISHNMESMSYEIDPTEVITRLVPLGERIESEDEDATDASQARLTIADVNDGIDYLDDLELQKEFGIIEREVTWDDVTTPQRLLTNGRNFLRDQKTAITSYSVDAVNLRLLGLDIDSFDLGNRHPLINHVLSVDEKIQIIEKKTDITTPQKSSLKIGDKHRTLSQYQAQFKETEREVVELRGEVDHQRKIAREQSQALKQAQDELDTVRAMVENIDAENIEETLALITQQLIDITEMLNDIGYELTDLDLRMILLEDFKVEQEHFNHQQELINEDVLERLEALENPEGDNDE